MTAMTITDYNGVYGAMDLYKSVKDYNIKPIIGVDLPWTMDLSQGEPRSVGYITFLARSVEGYHTLLRLVSAAYMRRSPGELPFVDLSLLREHNDDLIAFWG
ncbi:MAG: PHP domain-containing protein [Candidatus Peribacteria bacterium]|nr:MAG: PHP domain-containing protein [Candidatus Peribacteria bacterium]